MNNYVRNQLQSQPANKVKRGKQKLSMEGKTATEAEEKNTAHYLWKVIM